MARRAPAPRPAARPRLRVVAGSLRGRRLVAPTGDAVRPTKDVVKEAVFSALDARGAIRDATVMVVEDADRFGLLQLHQLRGRIGRGEHASVCFLLADPSTAEGRARLEAMAASSDGFELAERDLEIRGAGEVFGERQSGWTDLKLGRLPRDEPVVVSARAMAESILDADPDLAQHPQLREEVEDLLGDAVEFLFKV